jgi:tRNA G46 methylase TrmB
VYPIAEKAQELDPEQVFFVDIGGGIGHHTVDEAAESADHESDDCAGDGDCFAGCY